MLVDEGKRSRDLETLLRNKGGTFLENHEDQDSTVNLFSIFWIKRGCLECLQIGKKEILFLGKIVRGKKVNFNARILLIVSAFSIYS